MGSETAAVLLDLVACRVGLAEEYVQRRGADRGNAETKAEPYLDRLIGAYFIGLCQLMMNVPRQNFGVGLTVQP